MKRFTSATVVAIVAVGFCAHTNAFSPVLSPKASQAIPRRSLHMFPIDRFTPIQMQMTTQNKSSKKRSIGMEPEKKPPTLVSMVRDAFDRTFNSKKDTKTTKMTKKRQNMQWVSSVVAAFVLAILPLYNADAAMTGGRMGGSSHSSGSSHSVSSSRSSRSSSSRGYSSSSRGYSSSDDFFPSGNNIILTGGGVLILSGILGEDNSTSSVLGPGTSVVQLSVALEVADRDEPTSILSVLDRLARTAKTDSRVGIQNLSSEVSLEILRRCSSVVLASSSTKHFSSRSSALREFQNLSISERSKVEMETVNKFDGIDHSSARPFFADKADKSTMVVITLILAIDGNSTKVNNLESTSDVKQALRMIASDSKCGDCLQSAEILWTPEDRSETLDLEDVMADYPDLQSIQSSATRKWEKEEEGERKLSTNDNSEEEESAELLERLVREVGNQEGSESQEDEWQ